MKLNDYVLRSDIEKLSKSQYQAFKCYLKFVGIANWIKYEDMEVIEPELDILVVASRVYDTDALLWSILDSDPDIVNQFSYEEILRMAAIGEAMNDQE